MKLQFNINLTSAQQDAYDLIHTDGVKFITLCFSRQAGKSTLMQVCCIEWLFTQPNVRIGYVCRSYLLGRKIYKEILSVLPQDSYKSANGSELTIVAKNGSTLQFFSAESGNALRGWTFDYFVADEFAFYPMELTDGTNLYNDVLYATVKVRAKKVIFVSTPCGKQNLFYEMYQRGLSDDYPDYASLVRSIYDDDLTTPEQIEQMRKSLPPMTWKQEFEVQFLDNAVTFFQGFEKCYNGNLSYNDKGKVFIGIDFSSNGEDRTVLTKINGDGEIFQEVVQGSLDMRYRRLANLINETNGLVGCYYEDNSIGQPMANEVEKLLDFDKRRRFESFTTTNSSKDKIVSKLAVDIANECLVFGDRFLFDELAAFQCHYSKTGKPTYGGAYGSHDDRVMSLAIANNCRSNERRESSINFIKSRNNTIQ